VFKPALSNTFRQACAAPRPPRSQGPLAPSRDHASQGGEHSEGRWSPCPATWSPCPRRPLRLGLSTGPPSGSRRAPVEDAPYGELRRGDPAVASVCVSTIKGEPPAAPPSTHPPLLHARRRPLWGLLGERHFSLHSVTVPATLHLSETPWKPSPSRVAWIRPGLVGNSRHRG
jgi:hypothetical protein